eukprot:1348830-Amorphochlora_amoeboformis.AAC.1
MREKGKRQREGERIKRGEVERGEKEWERGERSMGERNDREREGGKKRGAAEISLFDIHWRQANTLVFIDAVYSFQIAE